MRPALLLCILACCAAQVQVLIQVQDGKGISLEKFQAALAAADLNIAGEPFSTLVTYEDNIVQVRALDGECAGGYYWDSGRCNACACANVPRAADRVRFAPLE